MTITNEHSQCVKSGTTPDYKLTYTSRKKYIFNKLKIPKM